MGGNLLVRPAKERFHRESEVVFTMTILFSGYNLTCTWWDTYFHIKESAIW